MGGLFSSPSPPPPPPLPAPPVETESEAELAAKAARERRRRAMGETVATGWKGLGDAQSTAGRQGAPPKRLLGE